MLVSFSASAQRKKAATSWKGAPCSSAAHRQFDFWVGEWEVQTPKGTAAGENKVEKILDGCALRESWTATDGSHGTSLTSYDAGAGRWTQTFVDDLGMVLVLDGELRDGKMVLSGRRSGAAREHLLEPHHLAEDRWRSHPPALGAILGRGAKLDPALRGHLQPEEGLSVEHPLASLTPDERALLALEDAVLLAIRQRDADGAGARV